MNYFFRSAAYAFFTIFDFTLMAPMPSISVDIEIVFDQPDVPDLRPEKLSQRAIVANISEKSFPIP